MYGPGDPIEAERVRRAARSRLFGEEAAPLRLGRFELRERIGAGGMGVVYAAHDPELARTVAVKLLTEEGASLLDEARAMAAVRHPSLVAVHDVGTWEGHVFLAMERVEGPSLREWLKEPRRPDDVIRAFAGAGRALAALHDASLIHRDFKPENVVIDADGRARLVDFGLARRAGAGGDLAGTPGFLAPEVVRGAPPSAASDQYAFAVALAACALPGRARRIVERGRAEDPAARWPSMTALVDALEHDPARGWRRGVAVAAVAGGLGVTVALLVGPTRDPAARCKDGRERLAKVWGDRRVAVADAFRASELPYQDAMWRSTERALDGYADTWSGARIEACRATVEQQDQSPDLMDRRMVCLDRRLAALGATVDVLAGADAAVIDRALEITDALPSVDPCADPEVLRASVPPPDDEATRAELAALEPRRAAGVALTAAARFPDAAKELDAVVADARALGYQPFLAEALLATGLAKSTANLEGGNEALFEAVTTAQAVRHVRVVAEAAMQLAGTEIFHEAWREAKTWTGLADASITAAGDDPRQRARWHGTMVQLRFNEGKHAEALEHAERAVAMLVEAGATDTVGYASELANLGLALGALDRREEALAKLGEALAIRERLLGPNHPDLANTLNNIAIIHEYLERWQDAYDDYVRAHAIAVAAGGAESPLAARILDHQAGPLRKLGRLDDALKVRVEALRIREAIMPPESTELAESLSNMGSLMLELERYDEADAYLLRALASTVAAYGELHNQVALNWLYLAEVSIARARYDEAIEREAKAIAGFEHANGKDCPETTFPLMGTGDAYIRSGRAREAIGPLTHALEIAAATKSWPSNTPKARFLLAKAHLALGDRATAKREAEAAKAEFVALDEGAKAAEVDAFLTSLK